MRIGRLAMLASILAVALVATACNGDAEAPEDEPAGEETPAVDADATPADEDEDVAETPEDEDATPAEEEATPEDEVDATPEEEEATPEDEAEATPEATPEDDEATPDTDTGAADGETVAVTLTEMEIQLDLDNGESDDAEPVTLPAGTITFQITNEGELEHSLDIEPADDEKGEREEQELGENAQPGDSTEWEVELEPGDYVFFCPVGDHRDQGMELDVTVEENGDGTS